MYTKKNWKHIPTEKPVHDDHNSTIQYSQKCKEYKHLSADAWISQYGTYITMEYHPFIKRNNVLTHTAVINLKDMRITEKNQTYRLYIVQFILCEKPRTGKIRQKVEEMDCYGNEVSSGVE